MMLIVLAITGATGYVAENNLRANQERLLNAQFQNELRSFLAVQNLRSNAVADKSRDVSRSVRLRAALEEKDVDDLYRNALAELQDVFVPNEPADSAERPMRAAFFRFVDLHGVVLPPGDHPAGDVDPKSLEWALAEINLKPRNADEQNISFIAINRGNDPAALRQIVLTKIRGWDGNELGALVLGFPIKQARGADGRSPEIKSGIWLNHQFYIAGLSAPDRRLVAQRVQAGLIQDAAGNFIVDLENGPHLLFYKALNSQATPAY